jgi:hypothetical protein
MTSFVEGDDGDLQTGVPWPVPRFSINGDGTVTDSLTGLVWLRFAGCRVFFPGDTTGGNRRSWSDALTAANLLADGYCGLSDGSKAGDWRLPNIRELESLIHYGFIQPSLPNTAGSGQLVEGDPFYGFDWEEVYYWTSSVFIPDADQAWAMNAFGGGFVPIPEKLQRGTWAVRGEGIGVLRSVFVPLGLMNAGPSMKDNLAR